MPVGSSLTDQIGIATESTYGTYLAPTEFLLPAEKPDFEPGEMFIETLPYGSLVMGVDDSRQYEFGGAGTLAVDARIKGLGILLEQMFGTPASGVYTLAANPGKSATIQQGRTQTDGTVKAFNFLGCVMTQMEIAITSDANPRITTTWDVGTHETTTALATKSYPTGNAVYTWLDGAITKDGASACFRSLTITIARAMNTDRRCIGGTKKQQIGNGEIAITGQAEVEFDSMADYAKFRSGGQAALNVVLSHGGGSLTIDIPVLTYRSNAFGGNIGDVNTQTLGFKALKGAGEIITVTLVEPA